MSSPYEDILFRERPVSTRHARMNLVQRAAQFAPFAALTGYDAACRETARVTQAQRTMTEEEMALLNERLCLAVESGQPHRFTWYVPDLRKAGGEYVSQVGVVRRIEPVSGVLFLMDGSTIPVADLWEVAPPEDLGDSD